MRTTAVVVVTLALGAASLSAQAPRPTVELRPFAGVTIPTGSQRDLYKDAPIVGMGIGWQVRPNLHLVGNFGWMREHTKYAVTQNDASRYQYDAGVEVSVLRDLSASWTFRPFVGVGGGGRTYDYQAATLQTRTDAMGYGALGAEFQTGLTAVRIEARDNVFGYQSPLPGGTSETRNDITFALGLTYHLR